MAFRKNSYLKSRDNCVLKRSLNVSWCSIQKYKFTQMLVNCCRLACNYNSNNSNNNNSNDLTRRAPKYLPIRYSPSKMNFLFPHNNNNNSNCNSTTTTATATAQQQQVKLNQNNVTVRHVSVHHKWNGFFLSSFNSDQSTCISKKDEGKYLLKITIVK